MYCTCTVHVDVKVVVATAHMNHDADPVALCDVLHAQGGPHNVIMHTVDGRLT